MVTVAMKCGEMRYFLSLGSCLTKSYRRENTCVFDLVRRNWLEIAFYTDDASKPSCVSRMDGTSVHYSVADGNYRYLSIDALSVLARHRMGEYSTFNFIIVLINLHKWKPSIARYSQLFTRGEQTSLRY